MIRTQDCGRREARTRLEHAQHFLLVAEIIHDEKVDASLSVSAALCVLAGIAASDAACCAALGQRARGQDHHDAAEIVAQVPQVGPDMAKALRRLLTLKDEAHYGLQHLNRSRTETALRQARRLSELAERVLAR